jgi:hypothetical protein
MKAVVMAAGGVAWPFWQYLQPYAASTPALESNPSPDMSPPALPVAGSQVSDVAVVTATRDGMNLVPYEYVVCRQGPEAAAAARQSMLVVSGAAAAANTVKKVLT